MSNYPKPAEARLEIGRTVENRRSAIENRAQAGSLPYKRNRPVFITFGGRARPWRQDEILPYTERSQECERCTHECVRHKEVQTAG